jgi:hypothetical protein
MNAQRNGTKWLGAGLMAGMMLLNAVLVAAPAPAQTLQVRPGVVQVRVLDVKGQAIADQVVFVMRDGKVLQEAKTDKAGDCRLPDLAAGNYQLAVGKLTPMDFTAANDATLSQVSVVLPVDSARGAIEWAAPLTWVVIGGVVVAVAAAALIIHHNNKNDTKKVYYPKHVSE